MKQLSSSPLFQKNRSRRILRIVIISAVSIAVIAAMLWNTTEFKKTLNRSTAEYVSDVSEQLTSDISARIKLYRSALEIVAASAAGLNENQDMEQFLKDQAEILDFDALFIIDQSGNALPKNAQTSGLENTEEIHASFQGKASVSYTDGQQLLFSVPIYQGKTIKSVLGGLLKKERIQRLIQSKSYNGQGLSCIVDSSAAVVISPTELKPFLQLDNIFRSDSNNRTKRSVVEMMENISKQQSGVFQFTAINGDHLIMSYHPLGVNDWLLLTLIPADLISSSSNSYTFRFFLIVAGVAAVFLLYILAMLSSDRNMRRRLTKFAFTDPLTDGLNGAAFQMEYQNLAANMKPKTYSVVFLHIKGFKLINEAFGIDAGDHTLRYIHQVLKRHIGSDEIIARDHADHFFLCLKEYDKEKIRQRLDQLTGRINAFHRPSDIHYRFTLMMGIYRIDNPSLDVTIVQDRARTACKTLGENQTRIFYSSQMTEAMKREQALEALFEDSVQNHDFHVYLQPKVQLSGNRLYGAEALARWIHPTEGMIVPSEFIPVLEKSERICRLDLYVFEEVCRLLQRWEQNGRSLPHISVNLSRIHFKNLNFLQAFIALKQKYQIPDNIIEFELTESICLDVQQRSLVKDHIKTMHQHGFLCSLDDFGVGFSSLALLKEFDVDTIKLDRQFFQDISNDKAQCIITSFIDLANKLRIHTVAEGIEDQEQIDFLRKAHCDMVQGYFFSKPLPISDFEAWSI